MPRNKRDDQKRNKKEDDVHFFLRREALLVAGIYLFIYLEHNMTRMAFLL